MRHRVSGRKLNRTSQQRRALFKNLMRSLILHSSIQTTLPKAKAIQGQFDTLVSKAKSGTTADLRQIDKVINSRSLTDTLLKVIVPAAGNRTSGFTRIVRLKENMGDNATLVRLSLTDMPAVSVKPVSKGKVSAPVKTKSAKPAKTSVPTVAPAAVKPIKSQAATPITQRKTP